MASKPQIDVPQKVHHRPFVIRKAIVFSAAVLAIGGGFLFGSPVLGIALYFGLVPFFDGISYYLLHLKSSDFADPEELLKSERVNGQELDQYFDTRRNIRFASFGIACLAFAVASIFSFCPFETFCMVYVFSTICGIFYVRFFLNVPRPRLIYRDDRYYIPCLHRPKPGAFADFVLWQRGHGPLP